MNGLLEWQNHKSDSCSRRTGTNYGDPDYCLFRSKAIRLTPGWCFFCLIHQVSL